jgi:hypothetical protein
MKVTHIAAAALLAAATAVVAVVKAAAVFNPDGARPAGAKTPAPEPPKDGRIDDDVTRFYGAVGGTLCATLWDPGSSINMITPEFAQELSRRKGIRWGYCEPVEIQHGSGDGVKSAPPAVRSLFADVVLCCKGLTFVEKNVELDASLHKLKGRVVFQGHQVYDHNNDYAIFQVTRSSPATSQAAKAVDFFGLLAWACYRDGGC